MPLYERLGFSNHPFSKTNADEEPNLVEYFVPPPYFDAVVGDAEHPSASVVLAPRGSGKTALRRMVERHAYEAGFLAVTYDRFEFSSKEKVEDITLQYHLKNIIIRILVSFLSYVSEYPDVIKNLTKEEKHQLSLFIHSYLGNLTGEKVQELLNELKSLPEKFKEFWSKNVGILDSAINFILKNYELEGIELPDIKQEEKRLSETYKYQLELLFNLVKKIHFKSIYILIDKPDETEQTGNNAEATYRLIQPLIKDLELLGLKGYGFKFFLWDQIEPYYRTDARPDRIAQYQLKWTRATLKNVLSKRLLAFSANKIPTFQSIVDTPTNTNQINTDDIICLFSNNSPRNLIRLCEHILATQAERSAEANKIHFQAIDIGVINFSEMLFRENYGEELLRDIQRAGRELFTTNYIANDVLKISGQGARNKITGWMKSGAVKQTGTINISGSNRPVNFYCVVDPVAVRMIHRTEPLANFIQNRWIPCEHCLKDNLMDINLYPEDNPPICQNCGRELF